MPEAGGGQGIVFAGCIRVREVERSRRSARDAAKPVVTPRLESGAESVPSSNVRQVGLGGNRFKVIVGADRPAKRIVAGEIHDGQLMVGPCLGVHVSG